MSITFTGAPDIVFTTPVPVPCTFYHGSYLIPMVIHTGYLTLPYITYKGFFCGTYFMETPIPGYMPVDHLWRWVGR